MRKDPKERHLNLARAKRATPEGSPGESCHLQVASIQMILLHRLRLRYGYNPAVSRYYTPTAQPDARLLDEHLRNLV